MTWKVGYLQRKKKSDCRCTHPQITHYTQAGSCVYPGCECAEFKPSGKKEFRNNRARCEYNHHHDSGLEIKVCFDLYCQKCAGEIKDYESQKVVDLLGPSGAKVATYKVDFIVAHNDGTTEFVEAKGNHIMHLQPWPLKWKLLQDRYKDDPNYKFRVVQG